MHGSPQPNDKQDGADWDAEVSSPRRNPHKISTSSSVNSGIVWPKEAGSGTAMFEFKLPKRSSDFLRRCGRLPTCVKKLDFDSVAVRAPYEPVRPNSLVECECSDLRESPEGMVCAGCGAVQRPELRLPDAWEEGHSLVMHTSYNHKTYVEKILRGGSFAFTHREMIAVQGALNVLRPIFAKMYPKRKNFLCYPYVIDKILRHWDNAAQSRIIMRNITARTLKSYDTVWNNITKGFPWQKYISIATGSDFDTIFKCYPLNKGIIPDKTNKQSIASTPTSNMSDASGYESPVEKAAPKKAAGDRKRSKPEKPSKKSDKASPVTVVDLFESVAPNVSEYTSRCHADGRPRNMTYLNHKQLYTVVLESAPRFYTKGYDPKVDMETSRKNSLDQKLPFDLSFNIELTEEGAHALSGWHIFTDQLVKRDAPPRANINVKEWMNPEGYYKARVDYRVAEAFLAHLKSDHDLELEMEDIWKLPMGSYKLALEPFLVWKMGSNAGLQWKVRALKLIEKRSSANASELDNPDFVMGLI
jgi:hypothetical protein